MSIHVGQRCHIRDSHSSSSFLEQMFVIVLFRMIVVVDD